MDTKQPIFFRKNMNRAKGRQWKNEMQQLPAMYVHTSLIQKFSHTVHELIQAFVIHPDSRCQDRYGTRPKTKLSQT
jgi:hypothetical protein